MLVASNFAVLVVTSRALSPAEFGIFAAATIFIDLSWILANSTLGVSLIQRKDLSDETIRAGFAGYLVLSALVSATLAIGSVCLERLMRSPGLSSVLLCLCALIPLRLLAGFYGALTQRRLDLRYYQMTQSLPQIAGGLATIAGAVAGMSVWCLVLGFAIASTLECTLLLRRAQFMHRLPRSWRAIEPLMQTALATASQRLLSFTATNVDRLIIGATFGAGALAIYTRAYSLMMVPVKLIGMTLERVLLAVFSKMQDQNERLGSALGRVVEMQSVLHLPLGIGLAWSTPLLVHAVLGSTWNTAIAPAQLFFMALVARLGTVPLDAALVGSGRAWTVARLQVAYALMVVLSAIAGATLSPLAVAVGVTCALLTLYMMELAVATKCFGFSGRVLVAWHFKGIGLSLLACAGPATAAWAERGIQGWLAPTAAEVFLYWITLAACILLSPAGVIGEEAVRLRSTLLNQMRKRNRT
ncbi:oligosaccharide flippase family protein [Ramlibacter sp. Leaf400]|uniref:oligosaccharide flippase family protein n=1 Tax=Ramlibacter sp. Leaf400 TaxID=1736365 RepID=UPI00138F0331|nr:oligosaccharide flippase family protein [Ramlibacter sp. Leaf400]